MQGPVASLAEITQEFIERKNCVDQDAHEKREQKRDERKQAKLHIHQEVHRGNSNGETGDSGYNVTVESLSTLEVPDFDIDVWKTTRFFTTGDPFDYMVMFLQHLDKEKIAYH